MMMMVRSLAMMRRKKRCRESAREYGAHAKRCTRTECDGFVKRIPSILFVCFFPRAVRRAPLDKEDCAKESASSPPGEDEKTRRVSHRKTQKERGGGGERNFVSRISRVFYPSRGFKNASNVKKRSGEMRFVRARERLRVSSCCCGPLRRGCIESARADGGGGRQEEKSSIGLFVYPNNFFLRSKP